ncbi:hypothetical protein [Listeria booriae]|uniref:hypothetical protein n=1 Tax=Listeria booriae TaxID=1552123 RepID=UPI001627079B|nr:hypothetical protein [Listeria booriae]MBC2174791.1 hypothetical protein [Listeria booriae]
MGCDIHAFVEVKNKKSGKWNTYLEADGGLPEYIGRNYDLYAILANVRNGYGFAGIDTGDGFECISKPRGVPFDASETYLSQVEEWGSDGHSHSFLTLAELQSFDWEGKKTNHRGYLRQRDYKHYKETGELRYLCDDVSGVNVVKVNNDTMEKVINGTLQGGSDTDFYTQIQWEESYAESCDYFLKKQLPILVDLARQCDTSEEDIRISFFFDN